MDLTQAGSDWLGETALSLDGGKTSQAMEIVSIDIRRTESLAAQFVIKKKTIIAASVWPRHPH